MIETSISYRSSIYYFYFYFLPNSYGRKSDYVSFIPLHHRHPNSRISRKRIHTFPAPEEQVIRPF